MEREKILEIVGERLARRQERDRVTEIIRRCKARRLNDVFIFVLTSDIAPKYVQRLGCQQGMVLSIDCAAIDAAISWYAARHCARLLRRSRKRGLCD
jgi:hypothetical protein